MVNEPGYTEINGNPAYQDTGENGLKATALRFIHNRCKYLGFNDELNRNALEGTVPYNQERDTDRLCLENAVSHFLESGLTQDAFDVYVCYIEMFFASYASSRHIIEMLSEFETNGSSLLMKHRDHYAHSVYVFCLGLAIYESNENYRKAYLDYYRSRACSGDGTKKDSYGAAAGTGTHIADETVEPADEKGKHAFIDEETAAAHNFLKYWGLSALFHDIGYPFELPFEQVCGYFESNRDVHKSENQRLRNNRPFMAYHYIERFTALTKEQSEALERLYGLEVKKEKQKFATTDELFAYELARKFGEEYRFTAKSMVRELHTKPTRPDLHDYYMDHAYFSATVLFRELSEILDGRNREQGEKQHPFTLQHIDALTAILMHNSLFKFSISYYKEEIRKPLQMQMHPLAYLLMLCDELQCWDRTSYGRDSRTQVHPYDCELSFKDNGIEAQYLFDSAYGAAIQKYRDDFNGYKNGKNQKPKLKSYSDFYQQDDQECDFAKELRTILDVGEIGSIHICADIKEKDQQRKTVYLSDSSFIHLYDFAVALNYRYSSDIQKEKEKMKQGNGAADGRQAGDDLDALVGKILPSLKTGQDKRENSPCYRDFEALSLEYKLSNINQAKAFAKYLNLIGGFYTDRPLNLVPLDHFSEEDMKIIGVEEHYRWLAEHEEMGWKYGEQRDNVKRLHYDCVPEQMMDGRYLVDSEIARKNYIRLDKKEQEKDIEPFNLLVKLLPCFEGVRFYRIPGWERNH